MGRKDIKKLSFNILRERILYLLKERTIRYSELKKELNIKSFGSLTYHLNLLLDKRKIIKKKNDKKQFSPTFYSITDFGISYLKIFEENQLKSKIPKLCECGCGRETQIISHTDNKVGRIKGEYNRFIMGHMNKGKHWKIKDKTNMRKPKLEVHRKNIGLSKIGKKNPSLSIRNHKRYVEGKNVFPKKDTKIELKIQDFLTALRIEFLTHKYMNIQHGYQCDILIPEQKGISQKIIIECDGDFFHMNPNKYSPEDRCFKNGMVAKEKWKLDDNRTRELIEKGFKVIRLWEHEIKAMELNDLMNKLNP